MLFYSLGLRWYRRLSAWGVRNRACVAVIDNSRTNILMVLHRNDGKEFWTLPGGALEGCEEFGTAVARECLEETGYSVAVHDFIFEEEYRLKGRRALKRCFLGTILSGDSPRLVKDPEEADRSEELHTLRDAA